MKDFREYEAMAKLDLSAQEREWLSERAEKLIEEFSALEKIDTSNTEPLVTVLDLRNILREDTVKMIITREELLSNAPEQYDGCFQVPKTLE